MSDSDLSELENTTAKRALCFFWNFASCGVK